MKTRVVIKPIQGQANLLVNFKAKVLAAIAGTGGGKTILGYWWLHSRMEAYPGYTWGLAEPTYSLLSKVILTSSDPERPSLIDYLKQAGHRPDFHAVDKIVETAFGKIYLGSADNPDSMQGAALRGYWLDEAGLMSLGAYQTALQRVSMLEGQVLITTTPYKLGWLKTEVVDKADGNEIVVERWRSIDRPGFPIESYEAMKSRLPAWEFAMRFDARFERPAGLIYDCFDENVAVIKRFPIPDSWPCYSGHDFGGVNPGAMFYAVEPGTGNIFAFWEYLPGPKPVAEQVADMKVVAKGKNIVKRVGGSHQEEGWRNDYSAHGWPIAEPKPQFRGVEVGISRVYALHKLGKVFIFSDLKNYLDEKLSYSRKLDENYLPTEEIENKARYHLMDAERSILSDFTPETVSGPSKSINLMRPAKRAYF